MNRVDTARARERFSKKKIYGVKGRGYIYTVILNFGFMEEPLVEKHLEALYEHRDLEVSEKPENWIIRVIHKRVILSKKSNLFSKIRFAIFKILQRNSDSADIYFGLGINHNLTVEILPVVLK